MTLVLKHKGIEDYKRISREGFNELEFPKWKRLKMKGLALNNISEYNKSFILSDQKLEDDISGLGDIDTDTDYLFDSDSMNEYGAVLLDHHITLEEVLDIKKSYGVHKKFNTLSEGYANSGFLYYAPKGFKRDKPVEIFYEIDTDHPTIVNHNLIVADAGAEVSIIVHYTDTLPDSSYFMEDEAEIKSQIEDEAYAYYHVGLTKIIAHQDAKVHLIKMQDFSDYVLHIDSAVSVVSKDAKVFYNTIDLGGHVVVTDYTAYLEGEGSASESKTAYLGSGKRRLDIGFNIFHIGRYTDSLIQTKGALLEESRKIFRGNLKFEKGSKRSTGSESEYVLLLDPWVHSDAIPALLCDEDDVSGEHAASAGQVNENQLFYLMSRGFSKKAAMKLIIHGNFADVIDALPTEGYKTYVDDVLNRRLVDGY